MKLLGTIIEVFLFDLNTALLMQCLRWSQIEDELPFYLMFTIDQKIDQNEGECSEP